MQVLFSARLAPQERQRWLAELHAAAPEAQWLDDAAARSQPEAVRAAVVANPEPGALQGFPNLALIQSLWAGVDRLLADPTVPAGVPLARMVDPAMNTAMAETALWATLSLHRGFFAYQQRQRARVWREHGQRRADEVSVLVLGHGQMGQATAALLARQGYRVATWRATGAAELQPLLASCEVLINLLPLTAATRGLINAGLLAQLPRGAALVNLARGAHVVDEDLLAALDSGHLRHAVLDVFHTEPLPPGHRFWSHPNVTLLPHVAAQTDPRSASAVVAANLRALACDLPLAHLVQRQRGY